MKDEMVLLQESVIQRTKYLNNIVEQDHRFIKKITNPMLGFKSFQTAEYTLQGIEAMHMLRKGQVELQDSPVSSITEFISNLFHLSA